MKKKTICKRQRLHLKYYYVQFWRRKIYKNLSLENTYTHKEQSNRKYKQKW